MSKTVPILGAALLVLAGSGVVAYRKLAVKDEAGKESIKPPVVIDPGVLELDPFVLNLADPAGDRYFRLNLSLVLDQRAIASRVGTGLGEVKLRDRILNVLSRKRAGEMTTPEGKEKLRLEIQDVAEALLGQEPFYDAATDPAPAHVLDVLFREFLVQ